MSEPASTPEPLNIEELQQQLTVLEKKLADAKEPVVREALQSKVTEIATLLGPELAKRKQDQPAPKPRAEPKEEEPLPEPPSPQAILEADNLIRQAKVAKMRQQPQEDTRLLEQAAQVAQGAPNVLEMLGDELLDRKRYGEARVAYEKAHRLDPSNVTLERKWGLMVLRTTSPMSFEAAMRMADSPFVDPNQTMASAKAATMLSVLIPGAGQLVLGETKKGFIYIGIWLVCTLMLMAMSSDIQGLIKETAGQKGSVSGLVFIPIVAMLVVYVVAVGGCASRIKKHWSPSARAIDRPVPPENLPFE